MKIALFGGSFDPPHLGHQSVVTKALEGLDIDKLIIMPAFVNPFKRSFFADEKQRFLWAKKIWGNLDRVEICDFEIKQNRSVPTIESVEYLEGLYEPSKFYCIIGADHLEGLQEWHGFERLMEKVEFIIAHRDNIAIPHNFQRLDTRIDISSTFIRQSLNTDEVSEVIRDEVRKCYENLHKTTCRFKNL
ncbi:nicotinate (nicotinamide) nucleotide adenylyltransferase [Campylobacter sp.]|uniref:nicotinate (nicotinamide) nucleotide adenylyltransferase n=1 Tax=Campylobacter sp. TaxID=205 RepID=UPI0026DAE7E6|nr:nicotinate (nicotinamide) nucleotide adenylyltransferase [Campylobacter sp.]MDO4674319.1 nicotinate (nicotinamide) nucleotide adenylyltransferase [Campylobacter sp.]